jgi:ubiquitin-activating enzyme E1
MKTSFGTPFWGGAKKPPKPISFDPKDPLHLNFIKSASILRANNFNIKIPSIENLDFGKIANSFTITKFVPKVGVKIATTTEEEKEKDSEEEFSVDDSELKEVLKNLDNEIPKLKNFEVHPLEFDKDEPSNYHINFITATSNLRARNYKIPEADEHKTKGIAGKIIPAMVTTTALITGLIGFEIYKYVKGKYEMSDFRNTFVNIALPLFLRSEPFEPPKTKYRDTYWSIWDKFVVDLGKDITIQEFLEHFKNKYKLEVSMISSGVSMIYNSFGVKNLDKKLSEITKEARKIEFLEDQNSLEFECIVSDIETDEDVDIPRVVYVFRGWK